MRLRPHHILCVQGFQGYGYNKEFIANMRNIVDRIKTLPNLEIELAKECDDICDPCPFRNGEVCSKTDVKGMDSEVLKEFGLDAGKTVPIKKLLNKKLNSLDKVCGKCESQAVCSYYALVGQVN